MGCDVEWAMTTRLSQKFQSTHPHGVRHPASPVVDVITQVSIHAPTWGATEVNLMDDDSVKFQSTHPHGVRHEEDTYRNK